MEPPPDLTALREMLMGFVDLNDDFQAIAEIMDRMREHGQSTYSPKSLPLFDAMVHVCLHEIVCQRILVCFPNDVRGCEAINRITRSFIKHKADKDVIFKGVDRWFGRSGAG